MSRLLTRAIPAAVSLVRKILQATGLQRAVYRAYNAYQFSDLLIHERMLADRTRVETYERALRAHVRPDQVVADLGTGTGILAFLAARFGARRVYAVDHAGILELAQKLAAANGIENVTFVRTHSHSFRPAERVDLIVHEQMGDTLVSEDLLANLLDWKRRILRPGGTILPGRFELYMDPAKLKDAARLPFLWEQRLFGFDFSALALERLGQSTKHFYRLLAPSDVDCLVSEPEPVLTLDLNAPDVSPVLPTRIGYDRRARDEARIDGILVYFRAYFDDVIFLQTYPVSDDTSWHWHPVLLRTAATTCRPGDLVGFRLVAGDLTDIDTWRWSVRVRPSPEDEPRAVQPPRATT
jgi:protein arginine N-methyltransferase 1